MKETSRINQFFSSPYSKRILNLSEPLKALLGIDVFWCSVIRSDGRFNQISNVPHMTEHYWDNNLYLQNPFLCHPNHLVNGFFFQEIKKDEYSQIQETFNQRFSMNDILLYTKKEGETAFQFGFAFRKKSDVGHNIYLNNLPLISKYADYFLTETIPYLPKYERYQIDIAKLRGEASFNKMIEQSFVVDPKEKLKFIAPLLGGVALTQRELEVATFLAKGYTAVQMGEVLMLSPRTVETFLNSIKNKLNCFSKGEVIVRYGHIFRDL